MFSLNGNLSGFFNIISIFFPVWLLHLIPVLLISSPIWFFARKRVKWTIWDFLIVILPFLIWVSCLITYSEGKSLSNLVEGIWLGWVVPLATVIRMVVGDRVNQKKLSIILLAVLCGVGVALWKFMPGLPE
ncbi:MAG: hypothetical protein APR63_14600 [Desulfuromonas sp. SDB]|nr:MAG: hypothetical protein APR63_14600 [Desulfuromonas sp. SDB]